MMMMMMGIAEPEGPRAAEELSFPFGIARIPSCSGRRGKLCHFGEALLAALGPASHVEQRHAVLVANAPVVVLAEAHEAHRMHLVRHHAPAPKDLGF